MSYIKEKVSVNYFKEKRRVCLRNKDFYHGFKNILNKKFNIYDIMIVFIFSYVMQTRNQAEIELKKICTQFATKIYSLLATNILYLANVIPNMANSNIVIATTVFCLSINIFIFGYYKSKSFVPDNLFLTRYYKVSNNINLAL